MNTDKDKKKAKEESLVKVEINKSKEGATPTKAADKPKHETSKGKKGCC